VAHVAFVIIGHTYIHTDTLASSPRTNGSGVMHRLGL